MNVRNVTEGATMSSIIEQEAAHFGTLAADWWNPKGSSAMLHKLNPVRLGYVRAQIDAHFGGDSSALRPLAGKDALDIGCGAGLLCEPLARMGANVTGVDAAPENIAAARTHAAQSGLSIRYEAGDFLALGLPQYDLVASLEVIEHVADPAKFIKGLAARLKDSGLLIISTPNRTAASRLLMIEAAERLGHIPPGTHHWDQFINPNEMHELLESAGLEVTNTAGIHFSLSRGLTISDKLDLNYIMACRHRRC
jgi:2-polyprenyl-6-hydroxyphenyl methylase / 3-demethylubiquinone-9 3-methyltransferase